MSAIHHLTTPGRMETRARSDRKRRPTKVKQPRVLAKRPPKCEVCAKIVKLFQTSLPPGVHWCLDRVELGSFDDVMVSTRCEIHPRMLQSVFGDLLKTAGVTKFKASTDAPKLHHAIAVDRDWIDGNLLRRWRRSCDKFNYAACQQWPESSGLSAVCPNWFIDTWRMCLVRGISGVPYVALSYVWGQEPFFKNTQQTLAQLQLDSAFTDSHRRLGVPRTIADAIAAVGLLDERYLWVDALCIVQNDDITRHAEINKMAYIFAGASITIIAAQGEDTNYGLRGLRSISQPRCRSQDIFTLAEGYNIVETRKRFDTSNLWASRGWTYQEHLFARRCLYFDYNGVRWDCKCNSFEEDIRVHPGSTLRSLTSHGAFLTPFPSLYKYNQLLNSYNTRNFTHPQDALSAFAGITTSLSRVFKGGFICGLPLMFLDIALCWQPNKMCERRLPSEDKEPTELGLPSWSWIGWKCEPDTWAWNHGNNYVKKSQALFKSIDSQQTLPTVNWFSRKWGTKETTPISYPQSMMQELKTSAVEGNEPPFGWERFDYVADPEQFSRDNPHWNSLVPPHYFYKHQRDPNSEFWYPIPSWYDTQEGHPINATDYDTLLYARTRRAALWLDGTFKTNFGDLVVSIRDNEGNWVGALRLQTTLCHNSSKDSTDSEEMIPCELVAISAGYALEGGRALAIDEWRLEERPKGSRGEKYEYCNVLWVEWKDVIAYRKALGRVMKSAWEAQDLEWIDLVLG